MRSTLADLLASRFPAALNIDPTDTRCLQYANSAVQRLITRGHWVGTTQNYTVALTDPHINNQTLTLPPQFATLEGIAICRVPKMIRPIWFLFNGSGPGISRQTDTNWCSGDRTQHIGSFCSFKDVPSGGGYKIRLQCDVANDVGVNVLVLGTDDAGNTIRTPKGGVWSDGELVSLAQSPGTLSLSNFSNVTDLQIPAGRSGQMWMYAWDGATNTLLGQFQAFETRPSYRRYLIPILPNQTSSVPYVDIIGKMNFIPVRNANDYLSIGNLEAIRLAAMAIRAEEEHMAAEAAVFMNGGMTKGGQMIEGAIQILDAELRHFEGDAAVPSIEIIQTPDGSTSVEALI